MMLRDYQRVAVDFLHAHDEGGLFLDMGLGKTATTLSALTSEHLPALVVAPKRVTESVWPAEVQRWRPDLSITVAAGPKQARSAALRAPADIVAISRDNVHEAALEPLSERFSTLILDELSSFKSRASRRWKAARSLRRGPLQSHVWGLTGTPAPNGLLDLWAQVYLLDGGARLGRTLTSYRQRWFHAVNRLPNGVVTEWRANPGAEEEIRERLSDLCLYMSNDGRVDLPPVTFNDVWVDLPPKARAAYKAMKDTMVADLGTTVHSAASAAIVSNRLSQIAAGFLYPDPDEGDPAGGYAPLHREKVAAVNEILEGTGSPVLIFYRYRVERDWLLSSVDGARAIEDRGALADWDAGKVRALVAHPASAGHGLNLQHGGHTMIWTSPPWSLEEWEQANARLARSGQQHPVVIHVIAARRTIDVTIRERLEAKSSVQEALLSHLESPL